MTLASLVHPSRRDVARWLMVAGLAAGSPALAAGPTARMRVIVDNDLSGDPDGLFQLAHHVLSPSVAIALIVGSHLHVKEAWDRGPDQAASGAAKARELLQVMGRADRIPVVAGAPVAIASRQDWHPSPATAAIVAEAMREDTKEPLYYCAGAGLTELALAWLAQPRIGKRLKLVWIGGEEHEGLALPPPQADAGEYNLTIDTLAAQIIFNESDIEIWQVPRDAYRQMLFSTAELEFLGATGPIGHYLKQQIDRVTAMTAQRGMNLGETYILGDSPLVTLTALQSAFQPDPSSSRYALRPTPRLTAQGHYEANPAGRPMRVYTQIDTRLTFTDMVAKIRAADRAPG